MNHEQSSAHSSTNQLISQLVSDLSTPSDSRNWFSLFWFSWIGCGSLMAMLTYLAMSFVPEDIHLPKVTGPWFWSVTLLWFSLSFAAALTAYSQSLIGKNLPLFRMIARGLALVVFVISLLDLSQSGVSNSITQEFHFYQGPCGAFVFLNGLLASVWMWVVINRATPLNSRRAGMWAAVSVGAIASGFMHMVCTHEGPAHEFVWHVIPLVLLTALGAILGKKLIRW